MTTTTVTLDRLREIEATGVHTITVDAVRRVAYLRVAQTRYEAPLEDAA